MKFSSQTQHKTKPKLLILLLSLMLTLSVIIPTFQYNTLEVYADYDDNVGGGDNDGDFENTTSGQAASYIRTGWLVYIADVNGQLCSPVAFVSNKTPNPSSYKFNFKTRIGSHGIDGAVNINKFPGWPLPVSSSGSNWSEVRKYFKENSGNVIFSLFGQGVADMCNANKENYYIILETCSWHGIPGRTENGAANHWGWVDWLAQGAALPQGKGFYCYNKIAISEYLDKQWPGLPASVSYLPSSDSECIPLSTLQSAGYGMAAFKIGEGGSQTTADESNPAFGKDPHDPANESTGIKTIIKNYRTVNDSTHVVTDDGCTHRDNVDDNITVEEEGEYKVVGWKTSNQKDYSLDSIRWPVPGRITQQGSASGSVTLNSPIETAVYVLLEKHEDDPAQVTGDADFIISQSTITRKIKLSMPDSGKAQLVKLKDTEFVWNSPAHKTA